jgi:hypothetical protein
MDCVCVRVCVRTINVFAVDELMQLVTVKLQNNFALLMLTET